MAMHARIVQPLPDSQSVAEPRGGQLAVRRSLTVSPSADPASILVVDDNDLVRCTFSDMLKRQGYGVSGAGSASEALERLAQHHFDVMLCDIYMPERNGLELLQDVTERYPDLAVILITGDATVQLAREAVGHGASDFVTKPCNQGELAIIVQRNLTRRILQQKHAQRYRIALEASNESVLDALVSALNTRDTETQGHSERVTGYTMEMCDRLGLPASQVYHIERGALLHDIGKIGIPDRILHKPGKLTPDEWLEMRKHPLIGYQMCAKIDILKPASSIVLHHHERWDGSGYPDGLRAEAIPLGARIFAVADALDAITSDRPYRASLPFSVARSEILSQSGKQFDPMVVQVFDCVNEARWLHIRANAAR